MLAQMLAPAAVLVLWTLIMLFWLAATRFPALGKIKDKSNLGKPGVRGTDLEGLLPDKVMWKSHNYQHLLEQPTIFYAASIILALAGAGAWDVTLAWTYVALRIIHSLWQSLVNQVWIRLSLFLISTIVLIALAVRAVMATAFG